MTTSTYIIRINIKTMSCSVHAATCSVVASRKPGRYVFAEVQADSATAAAKQFDADEGLVERGLKCANACACSKA